MAFKVSKEIYRLTLHLPKGEMYGLTSQMQRAAVSIPSNIAEGQQRGSTKEFKQFLYIARGSAAELHTQMQLSQEIYGLDVTNCLADVERIQKMLFALIQKI